ncbi:hypothetical protein M3Y14_15595 [Bacillus thuringiensis]|uniref:hypothetical protein n=1 Tax=Bacillus thuringiensis TaxID=1428 RepID=UPI0022246B00|nr:hypothetical protein [Bacillus thuringiensis]UYX55530.1 hypothetical protein M3Y14_15595 [Bacillus thuringiensis]
MDRPNWGIGGLVFVGCMFLGGGVGSMLGSAQTGWISWNGCWISWNDFNETD